MASYRGAASAALIALAACVSMVGVTAARAQTSSLEIEQPRGAVTQPKIAAKIAYYRITVPDIAKATDLYTRAMGFRKIDRPNAEPGEVVLAYDEEVSRNNPGIGLILMPGKRKGPASGNGYIDGRPFARIVFAVADVAGVVKKARQWNHAAVERNNGALLTDPAGNLIELIPLTDLPDRAASFSPTRITFAKIMANDDPATVDFYTKVLGLTHFGHWVHKQRVRETVFTYNNGPPGREPAVGLITTRYAWDYAETLDEADRFIKPDFVMDVPDPVAFAKKVASQGGRMAAGQPVNVMDTGGNIIEVLKAPAP
jgi:catechol 2,3-dioxygenase-like lactoylglutathione lyase family enzyme